ncbi:1439_t:CDS:2, partial [Dentiscutata heterogama]
MASPTQLQQPSSGQQRIASQIPTNASQPLMDTSISEYTNMSR